MGKVAQDVRAKISPCVSGACCRHVLPIGLLTKQVLFDLPDFMIISAYALLAVVWAEMFLQVCMALPSEGDEWMQRKKRTRLTVVARIARES